MKSRPSADVAPTRHRTFHFPESLLWGAATSAHQVEGSNKFSDWWRHEQAGRLPYRSGEACRHYELYRADFDLVRSWGHTAHRFSIEWSRIEPREGEWDPEAMAHYRDVVAALRERGIEPVATLHHFTNPDWFAQRGGWLRRDSARLFGRYVDHVAGNLPDVRFWITINEPTVYVKYGFVTGAWPPFRRKAWWAAARVLYAMARAHVRAYSTLHRRLGAVRVGFAHSAPWIEPCDPGRARDRLAATVRDFLLNRSLLILIRFLGRGRGLPLDFLGINYYSRTIVRGGNGAAAWLGEECLSDHHPDRIGFSDTGWEIYPAGLGALLERFSGLGVPLMVTENGIATRDEGLRRRFLREHLAELGSALEGGADVIGYLYWSLMDNFEWALGRAPRFGLAEVDFETQRRIPRPAAEDFTAVCRSRRLDIPEAKGLAS